ncbi:hypothetical protein UFOVP607_12 [uncultured Caudovirales phage]|uniref:Uncharacterized protein n=1 Tax=uncultured Caudovirales phage TaxID=2100421 RepID=A0A6J5N531_9CAUD|nr:hypothetical protein UFOVP607_12 [uncultured Caudovirales phage]
MSLNIEKLISVLEAKIDDEKRNAKQADGLTCVLSLTRLDALQDVLLAILEAKLAILEAKK